MTAPNADRTPVLSTANRHTTDDVRLFVTGQIDLDANSI
jgi:hypothetical protein